MALGSLTLDHVPLAGAHAYPYSRVLEGQLLSQTSRLPTRRPARNSHPSRRTTGDTIRSRALGVTGATIAPGPTACPDPAPPCFFHNIHSLAKKEQGAKRKKATTTGHIQIPPIGALNSYKGIPCSCINSGTRLDEDLGESWPSLRSAIV